MNNRYQALERNIANLQDAELSNQLNSFQAHERGAHTCDTPKLLLVIEAARKYISKLDIISPYKELVIQNSLNEESSNTLCCVCFLKPLS